MSLGAVMWIDAGTLMLCATILKLAGDIRATHPAILYLGFHGLVFTLRGWAIAGGSPRSFRVTETEVIKAMLIGDAFLLALTIGSIMSLGGLKRGRAPRPLSSRPVTLTALLGIPIGIFFMLKSGLVYTPGAESQMDLVTSYQTTAITWPGLLLLAIIYIRGFRWYLLWPLVGYVFLMAIQGESRIRAVIPVILLVLILLERRGRRWPSAGMMAALAAMLALFYPLDAIGHSIRNGTFSISSMTSIVVESTGRAVRGDNSEQGLLDMAAAGIGQADKIDRPLWGRHYLDLLYLPIPRTWMPDKPRTNQHIVDLSDSQRPLSTYGTVLTMPGESYADFRWVGVLGIGWLIGRYATRFYRRAYAAGYGHVSHFMYLTIAAGSFQIYRDGLAGLPLFVLVYCLPLVVIVAVNWTAGRSHSQQRGQQMRMDSGGFR